MSAATADIERVAATTPDKRERQVSGGRFAAGYDWDRAHYKKRWQIARQSQTYLDGPSPLLGLVIPSRQDWFLTKYRASLSSMRPAEPTIDRSRASIASCFGIDKHC